MFMKCLNRNTLKLIALITMLLDHIGYLFFPNIILFRIIGRLSFPIFAFFVSEGYKYTKSKKKYLLTMICFALLSQPIFMLTINNHMLNILFTFSFAIVLLMFIDNFSKDKVLYSIYILLIVIILITLTIMNAIDYGIFGVLLVIVFNKIKNIIIKYVFATICLCLLLTYSFIYQLSSILSIFLLLLYNGEKGNLNLKYLFYAFYPLHLFILFVIKLLL